MLLCCCMRFLYLNLFPSFNCSYVLWCRDRFRTTINVFGDCVGVGVVSHLMRKQLNAPPPNPPSDMSSTPSPPVAGNMPLSEHFRQSEDGNQSHKPGLHGSTLHKPKPADTMNNQQSFIKSPSPVESSDLW